MEFIDSSPGPHFFLKPFVEYQGKIPFIVTLLVEHLDLLHSELHDGIFRLSGQKSSVDDICRILDKGYEPDWEKCTDVHEIAGALKRYFFGIVSLDPLIDHSMDEKLISILKKYADIEEMVPLIKEIISNMPQTRRATLGFLLGFLQKIAQNADKNLMTSSNLGVVFSPTLFFTREVVNGMHCPKIIEILINKFDQIFNHEWFDSSHFMTKAEIDRMCCPTLDLNDVLIESERRKIRIGSVIPFISDITAARMGLKRPLD